MKKIHSTRILILSILLVGVFACQPPASKENTGDDTAQNAESLTLQGTWKMVAHQPADTNVMMAPGMNSVKIFTGSKMFMVNYDKDNSKLLMALGADYTTSEGGFTETLTYYSGDSTVAGTAVDLALQLTDKTYHQSGVFKSEEEGVPDDVIEEDFERLETSVALAKDQNPLVGVWKMEKAGYGDATEATPMPEGLLGIKVFTPGHFYSIIYKESGTFDFVTFGTYKVEGEKFHETIITSKDSSMIGMEITHDWKGDENSLMQKAIVTSEDGQSMLIEEHFTRME